MFIFENEGQVKNLKPGFKEITMLKAGGIIVTAKGG